MLVTPCFIVHRLDAQSPLLPPGALEGLDGEAEGANGPIELPSLLRALQAQPFVPPPPPAPRSSVVSPARMFSRGPGGRWGRHSTSSTQSARASFGQATNAPPGGDRDAPHRDGSPAAERTARRHSMPDLLQHGASMPTLPSMLESTAAAGSSPRRSTDDGGQELGEVLQTRLRRRLALVKEHMLRTNAEVLVLLEGVDPTTSSTVQARQSYTVDDICWDATFVPCARRQPHGGIQIDFNKLHAVLPLGSLLPASSLMRMPTHETLVPRHAAAARLRERSSGTGDATEEFEERAPPVARVN
jgi:hypothetical protein